MQKKRNSIALAMELRLFCIKPSIYFCRKNHAHDYPFAVFCLE